MAVTFQVGFSLTGDSGIILVEVSRRTYWLSPKRILWNVSTEGVSYGVIGGKEPLVKGTLGVGSCGISNPACLCNRMIH